MATATMGVYTGSLIDTFKAYEEVVLLNENGTPVEFDQEGEPRATVVKLHSEFTQFNYFKFTQIMGQNIYLLMDEDLLRLLKKLLKSMKVEDNGVYQTVILPEVDYSVSVNGKTVVVKFALS
ncbi:Sporulation and spore germination protein OS=Ureibacillus acetophenoni OX=614649 GN=SAMN05877842_10420 PE=4 SV=1 [Ureibacillus acetophenoni]